MSTDILPDERLPTDSLGDEYVRVAATAGIPTAAVAAAVVVAAGWVTPALGQVLAMGLTAIGGYGVISIASGMGVKTEIDPDCGCPERSAVTVPMTRKRAIVGGIYGGAALVGVLALVASLALF